jgi:hypothetical protein
MKVKQWKNIDGLVTHIANFHPQDGMILKTYTCKLHRKPIVKCSPISWHYHKISHRTIANLNDSPNVKIVTKKWSNGTWRQTKEQAHTMEEICHWKKKSLIAHALGHLVKKLYPDSGSIDDEHSRCLLRFKADLFRIND